MFVVTSYPLAVFLCVITMICWGSWANTQKLAGAHWRFELFYWDYVIGIVLLSLVSGLTLGSMGEAGRGFIDDLQQADRDNLISAFTGGVIFNAANILLVAAIAIAGMSVAFPVGIGLALILGVLVNWMSTRQGQPLLLFAGVGLVAVAIVLNALAYRRKSTQQSVSTKGLVMAAVGGLLMAFFYRFIAASMDLKNMSAPAPGLMTPYAAVFVFSIGILASNFVFNTLLLYRPLVGRPTSYGAYFSGTASQHLYGVAGGLIWGVGNSLNLLAAGTAGPAVSYGLGQGATLVAALWGVFIWKEFKDMPTATSSIRWMFICFSLGLLLIILAGR